MHNHCHVFAPDGTYQQSNLMKCTTIEHSLLFLQPTERTSNPIRCKNSTTVVHFIRCE